MGDRWTFLAVLPMSSYVHTAHSGQGNQAEAKIFVEKIKDNSDGEAPFFESDAWFYEEVLTQAYGNQQETPYKGRGRRSLPKQVPEPGLKYAQVVKERENGKVSKIETRLIFGDELEIQKILDESDCSTTISTFFVESRNGAYHTVRIITG